MLGLPTDQSFREIAFGFLRLAMEHGHMIANTVYGISWYTKKMGKHGMLGIGVIFRWVGLVKMFF